MLIPIVEMEEFEKIGFKKCKKPYNKCYYLCFARGVQYIFLSPKMLDINKWEDNDARIHKKANCRYRDGRTALEFMCELVKKGYVSLDYLEGGKMIIDISKITLENIEKYNKNQIRRCLICNEEFEITYRKQECCSKKCYYKNYHKNRKKLNKKGEQL